MKSQTWTSKGVSATRRARRHQADLAAVIARRRVLGNADRDPHAPRSSGLADPARRAAGSGRATSRPSRPIAPARSGLLRYQAGLCRIVIVGGVIDRHVTHHAHGDVRQTACPRRSAADRPAPGPAAWPAGSHGQLQRLAIVAGRGDPRRNRLRGRGVSGNTFTIALTGHSVGPASSPPTSPPSRPAQPGRHFRQYHAVVPGCPLGLHGQVELKRGRIRGHLEHALQQRPLGRAAQRRADAAHRPLAAHLAAGVVVDERGSAATPRRSRHFSHAASRYHFPGSRALPAASRSIAAWPPRAPSFPGSAGRKAPAVKPHLHAGDPLPLGAARPMLGQLVARARNRRFLIRLPELLSNRR